MKKPKKTLEEELKKMVYLESYSKDFPSKTKKVLLGNTNDSRIKPKVIKENKEIITDTPPIDGELQLEFWGAIVGGLARLGPWIARGGARVLPKFMRGITKVPTGGLAKAGLGTKNVGKIASGGLSLGKLPGGAKTLTAAQSKSILNARVLGGLKALTVLGGGGYLAASNMSGKGPGDAAASMEQWANGGTLSQEDILAIAFNPAVYDEAEKQGLTEEIPFTFQSEAQLAGLADMIQDATEGGEKYFGKGLVDFISFGATEGAGTDEESIYNAFRNVATLYDCSHLTGIYDLKYGSLIEELGDELNESDFQPILTILQDKPLCIINGKRIYTIEDLEKEMEDLSKDLFERPEGLPAYRITFKTLFGGQTVDVFVDTAGASNTAIVFGAGSKDYMGMFEYIENSEDKVYFRTLDGETFVIEDDEDKAKVMKIFNKADEGSDLMTLSDDIEVNGVVYEKGETLDMIEGPEGTADEYIDDLVEDNPNTAKRKPSVIQGAAISMAMGVNDFEVLEESIHDLRKVLNESQLVSEGKYTVKYDSDDDRHKISRRRSGDDNSSSKEKKEKSTPSATTAPSLEDAAAGNGLIKKGQKGTSINRIQKFLRMNESGVFDDSTHTAVKNYQSTNGLKVDGVIGPETASFMLKAMSTPKEDVASSNQEVKVPEFKGTQEDMKNITKTLEDEVKLAPTKEGCKDLISYSAELLPKKGGKNVYQALSHCYDDFNFIGGGSSKVKSEYGLTGKGDPKPTKKEKRRARQNKRRNRKK